MLLERSRSQARLLAQQDTQRRRYERYERIRKAEPDVLMKPAPARPPRIVPRRPRRRSWPTTILSRRTFPGEAAGAAAADEVAADGPADMTRTNPRGIRRRRDARR